MLQQVASVTVDSGELIVTAANGVQVVAELQYASTAARTLRLADYGEGLVGPSRTVTAALLDGLDAAEGPGTASVEVLSHDGPQLDDLNGLATPLIVGGSSVRLALRSDPDRTHQSVLLVDAAGVVVADLRACA